MPADQRTITAVLADAKNCYFASAAFRAVVDDLVAHARAAATLPIPIPSDGVEKYPVLTEGEQQLLFLVAVLAVYRQSGSAGMVTVPDA